MTFDEAFLRLIGHEGGYVADSRDPGGETKFGISRRSYPGEDIKGNLTLARAKTIYARDFWGPAGCDAVPDGIRSTCSTWPLTPASRPRSARCSARSTRRPMVCSGR